jgi:hypothetical protein
MNRSRDVENDLIHGVIVVPKTRAHGDMAWLHGFESRLVDMVDSPMEVARIAPLGPPWLASSGRDAPWS